MTNRTVYHGTHETYGWFAVVKLTAVILSVLVSMIGIGSSLSLLIWWVAQ